MAIHCAGIEGARWRLLPSKKLRGVISDITSEQVNGDKKFGQSEDANGAVSAGKANQHVQSNQKK